MQGPGAIQTDLINQATIRLNSGAETLVVEGAAELTTTGRLEITIGLGNDRTGSGLLQVTGSATLGGTLEIIQSGLYTPAIGDSFEILTFGSKTGNFQTTEGLDLKNNLRGQLEITDTKVTLTVVSP